MAKLKLPDRLEENNAFRELHRFIQSNPDLPDTVEIDFSHVRWITPPNVTFLSNFTHWFLQAGKTVNFLGMDEKQDAIRYLDDSGFFEAHMGKRLRIDSCCRKTTMPLKQVERQQSHGWLEFEFIPWIIASSGLTKTSLAEVKTSIQELFNNISDHTEFEVGCFFGQWYPQEKRIVVSIADFGQGIPDTVRRVLSDIDDNAAILKAVEDGFSTRSLPTNRGAGLYLLLLNIVQRFQGKITIRSGHGYVKFENRDGSIYTSSEENPGFCIGTTIDLVIWTDKIPFAEEEEEFEW